MSCGSKWLLRVRKILYSLASFGKQNEEFKNGKNIILRTRFIKIWVFPTLFLSSFYRHFFFVVSRTFGYVLNDWILARWKKKGIGKSFEVNKHTSDGRNLEPVLWPIINKLIALRMTCFRHTIVATSVIFMLQPRTLSERAPIHAKYMPRMKRRLKRYTSDLICIYT